MPNQDDPRSHACGWQRQFPAQVPAANTPFKARTCPAANLLMSACKTCCACPLRTACQSGALPDRMSGTQPHPHRPPLPVFSQQRLVAGQTLYSKGDAFKHLHAVRAGSLKSSLTLADGRIQVAGFHLPGDVIGLDGVANDCHQITVTALEDTQTCTGVYGPLLDMACRMPSVQRNLNRLMSHELSRVQWHLLVLGGMSATERLAALLLDLSRRLASRGYSPTEFNLRMTRNDIGSYLGVTPETVYRVLKDFKAMKLIEVNSRHIRIVDLPAFVRAYGATVDWRTPTHDSLPPQHGLRLLSKSANTTHSTGS